MPSGFLFSSRSFDALLIVFAGRHFLSLIAMKFLSILLAPLFVASYVSAHGRVDATAASGQTFTINHGEDTPNDNTPIRRASSQDPITEFGNNALTCGTGANPAPFSMAVNPGETVQIYWRDFAGGKVLMLSFLLFCC